VKSTDPNRLLWVGGADENPRGHPTLLRVLLGDVTLDDRELPLAREQIGLQHTISMRASDEAPQKFSPRRFT